MVEMRTDSIFPKKDFPETLSDFLESRYQVGGHGKGSPAHDDILGDRSINLNVQNRRVGPAMLGIEHHDLE
jgi:hypothetical protein